jgi:predicted RNA-binding Zn ribbon-like protein
MNDTGAAKKFQFVGANLCLNFCNTVGGKRGVRTRENLHVYADLLSWCNQAGLLDEHEAAVLARRAARIPADASRVLARAIKLREAIYGIFAALAVGKVPPEKDLNQLNSELSGGLGRLQVAHKRDNLDFFWHWPSKGSIDEPLGPIARAAAELLTSGDWQGHVRSCQGENCGWLFLDTSKNHSRRWCDMRDCGNRAKVRRHRLKQRRRSA